MDITEYLQAQLIAWMEDVLGDFSPIETFLLELTITPTPVTPSTLNTTRYCKQVFIGHEGLCYTLQSLRASSAPILSSTPE